MASKTTTLHFKKNDQKKNIIIFVHGFIGGLNTWVREDNAKSIYNYLLEDKDFIQNFDIAVFDYFTRITDSFSKSHWWLSKLLGVSKKYHSNLSIDAIADILQTEIDVKCNLYDNIILVAHSMGGLICKSVIIKDLERTQASKIKLYVSLAVPHNGSDFANLGRLFIRNPQVENLRSLGQLISKMTQDWIHLGNKLPRTLYIQGKNDIIVPPTSSRAFDSRTDNLIDIHTADDHSFIIKPDTQDHVVIPAIKQQCLYILQNIDARTIPTSTQSQSLNYPLSTSVFRLMEENRKKQIIEIAEKLKSNISKEFLKIIFFKRQFKNRIGDLLTYEDVLKEITSSDFVTFYGIGGIGKSLILKRIVIDLIPMYTHPLFIFCDAKNWNDKYSSALKEANPFPETFAAMLDGFEANITYNDIHRLEISKSEGGIEKFIFVDGLNEVSSDETRKSLLHLLKNISRILGFKIIITTRNFKQNELKGYDGYKVERIDESELSTLLSNISSNKNQIFTKRNLEYLSIPFFLDIALKYRNYFITEYSSYIYSHILKGIDERHHDAYLNELSKLAFDAYSSEQKFIIPRNKIQPKQEKMFVRTNILQVDALGYKFEHQLVNECLVAFRMSRHKSLWIDEKFDLITFEDKKAFEIIQMILEQISNPEDGEEFLTKVYNWNFYAVLHCLQFVEKKYSDTFARVIILILSEKLIDKFHHTRTRILQSLKDLLAKFNVIGFDDAVLDAIEAMPREERLEWFNTIVGSSKEYFHNTEYDTWYDCFSYSDTNPSHSFVSLIVNENPLIGWTCSNVLKRINCSSDVELQLMVLFSASISYTSKWRIVHALGNCNSDKSIQFLFEVLTKNEFIWVSYGAARSLIEISMFYLSVTRAYDILDTLFDILNSKAYAKEIIEEVYVCLNDTVVDEMVPVIILMFDKMINSDHENFDKDRIKLIKQRFIDRNNRQ